MRRKCCVWLWVIVLGALCSAAQRGDVPPPGEQFIGSWSGTWDGAGTGGFELRLAKEKDNAIVGNVSVSGEPAYGARLMELSFDGQKMSAKYDFPPDPGGEVRLVTTFDGNKATGTWALHEKATGNQVAAGTWTVTKK